MDHYYLLALESHFIFIYSEKCHFDRRAIGATADLGESSGLQAQLDLQELRYLLVAGS